MRTWWLLLVALMAVPAVGEEREYPVRAVNLLDFGGKIAVSGEIEDRKETDSGTDRKFRKKRRLLEETVELDTRGYFYHPNLVDWFADVSFTLEQNQETLNNRGFDSSGRILEYDLEALILKEKPVSFRLFGTRISNVLHRDFASTFRLRDRTLGGEVLLKGPFPASLLVEAIRRREEDVSRIENERSKHLEFRIADRRDPALLTEFRYERDDVDETVTTLGSAGGALDEMDQSFVRDEFNLTNNWRFGKEGRENLLLGGVHGIRRRGFYRNEVFSADQRLELAHSDTFSTFYQLGFSSDETDNSDEQHLSGRIGFSKQIYDSLDIDGLLYFRNREFLEGTEDIRGGTLDINYRKKTPIGLLSSSLGLGKEYEKEESDTGLGLIRDEAVVLTGITFSPLSELGIVANTIVVTNDTRTITYDEGSDYIVRRTGGLTEIARVLGGTISNGQTVLVDYAILQGRDSRFVTDRVGWANRLQLKHLPIDVYFSYDLDDRQLRSGDDPGNLETEKIWLGGIELDYRGLNVIAEHERVDQELSPPFSETRLSGRYRRRIARNLRFSLGGNAAKLRYRETSAFGLGPGEDFQDTYGVFANLTAKPSRNTLIRLDAKYTRTRGRENDELGSIGAAFEWKYGNLDFSIEGRHNVYEQESTSGRESLVLFSISRSF